MRLSLLLLTIILAFSCSSLKDKSFDDSYWEKLNNKSLSNGLMNTLKNEDPRLYDQIDTDSLDGLLTGFWGQSLNFDSGAQKIILNEKLISELQKKFNILNDNYTVHAGIMHTYGYLLSVLQTPYGLKRKRWTEPTISYAFNLNGNSISSHPLEGTLLSNLTYFAGKISFVNFNLIKKLELLKNVSNEIKNLEYKNIKKTVLVEKITYPANVKITLRTTLVKLPRKLISEENEYLLFYTCVDDRNNEEKLVTVFPIKKDAYQKIIEISGLGEDRPILMRYNIHFSKNTELRYSGKRTVESESLIKM